MALLLTALLLSTAPVPAGGSEPYKVYIPTLISHRSDGLGFEVNPGQTAWQPELAVFAPVYLRSTFGNWQDPTDTLYQHYLAGGWPAVDAEVRAELDLWRDLGATPIIPFMYGGDCAAPSIAQLEAYGTFIVQAANRYNLRYVEVWNEPDNAAGLPSLYGCFGTQHTDRLEFLARHVNNHMPSQRYVGVSFALGDQAGLDMLAQVAPVLDWVGFHHYGIYFEAQVLEPWPGDIATTFDMVRDVVGPDLPVGLTEVNLRSPSDECGPAHQVEQETYLAAALVTAKERGAFVTSVLVYADYPNWQCTGVRNNPAAEALEWPYP